ncbi:MAG: hypothetical protein J0M12_11345 [Deltaproteobacteria bacterium]|nr:hypothetical protein [Deltaproteobacteria bacterium]
MPKSPSISYKELQSLLPAGALHFFEPEKTYPLQEVPAHTLLRAERFDLGVKAHFAQSILQGKENGYAASLYAAHLAVWNGFYENTPSKDSLADFTRSFVALATSPSQKQILPTDANLSLIDGAHRASLAIIRNQDVTVARAEKTSDNYNYEAFASYANVLQPELAEILLDQMAFHFSRFQPDARCVCIFPSTEDAKGSEIEKLISSCCSIYYRKQYTPSAASFRQLLLHLYYLDERRWIGTFANDFAGLKEKLSLCFKPKQKLTLYFVTGLSNDRSLELKEQIRSLFELQKHSCHIGNSHAELMMLAEMSLHSADAIFDKIQIPSSFTQFASCFEKLQSFVNNSGIAKEDFCIAGSTILAMLGIRDCRDIDLIFSPRVQNIQLPEGLGNHASEQSWYPASFEDITSDPRYYFYFFGFKVARPWVIFKFKKARAEDPKDLNDVRSLLQVFPDLDSWEEPYFSKEALERAAERALKRILREKDEAISYHRKNLSASHLSEIQRAAELQQQLLSKEEEITELRTRAAALLDDKKVLQKDVTKLQNKSEQREKELDLCEHALRLKTNLITSSSQEIAQPSAPRIPRFFSSKNPT